MPGGEIVLFLNKSCDNDGKSTKKFQTRAEWLVGALGVFRKLKNFVEGAIYNTLT